jgi:hypothetical protein
MYMCMHAHSLHARRTQIIYEPAGENEKAGEQVACVHFNVTSSARNSISETRSGISFLQEILASGEKQIVLFFPPSFLVSRGFGQL